MKQPRWLRRAMPAGIRSVLVALAGGFAMQAPAMSQENDDDSYLLGEETGLEMVVHVLGEVKTPGEYRVPDDTDVLELVSKAGGPTEFAHLGNVSIRRRANAGPDRAGRVYDVDLSRYLNRESAPDPPQLAPSDVVFVPRNKMAKWRTAFAMVRDISVVATAYLLYLRVEQND